MSFRSVILIFALLITVWLSFFAEGSQKRDVIEARTPVARVKHDAAKVKLKETESHLEAVVDRGRLIEADEKLSEVKSFGPWNWTPVVVSTPAQVAPVAPTVAPPLPFQYIGKKFEDGVYEVYLSRGGQTYSVVANSTIDNVYRVDSIKPPLMYLTYLPMNQVQTLSIGQAE